MGRLTKKIHRHPKWVTSKPPSVGPAMTATPLAVPYAANATPRFSTGKRDIISGMLCGASTAAPTPCKARAAMS